MNGNDEHLHKSNYIQAQRAKCAVIAIDPASRERSDSDIDHESDNTAAIFIEADVGTLKENVLEACQTGDLKIISYLVREKHIDPTSCASKIDIVILHCTLLHLMAT